MGNLSPSFEVEVNTIKRTSFSFVYISFHIVGILWTAKGTFHCTERHVS